MPAIREIKRVNDLLQATVFVGGSAFWQTLIFKLVKTQGSVKTPLPTLIVVLGEKYEIS